MAVPEFALYSALVAVVICAVLGTKWRARQHRRATERARRPRVVIAGLGDAGLLVAIELLFVEFDVIGISPKPLLVSGQELGSRLSDPAAWRHRYLCSFSRFRRLDGMPTVHGLITAVDLAERRVRVREISGKESTLDFDVLVIASGVRNGFWRNPTLEDRQSIERRIESDAQHLARARSIAVVGGGASAVSAASNLKERHPGTEVHLFFSRHQPLPEYHPKVRKALVNQLTAQGVKLHAHHRAALPPGFTGEHITTEAVQWVTGQAPFRAEATIWAVGKQQPNTSFLPPEILDAEGFVRVDKQLRVPGFPNIFALGDVAATDPQRCSARNEGHKTVAHNIRCLVGYDDAPMKQFSPKAHRWGSVVGVQRDGLRVFSPWGWSVRIWPWVVEHVLFPWFVELAIYKGMRPELGT